MNILMMTNTYAPYFGGVDKSIRTFTECFRKKGHRVVIVAPKAEEEFEEEDVIRVASIKNFNDIGFPVTIPLPGSLHKYIDKFQPDIVHSHFPFLVGSTAMRVAASYEIPLVFTYHTMYERYIHYVSASSERVKQFVITVTKGYADLCDLVIAPSKSVADVLKERGLKSRTVIIPTGVDNQKFARGDGVRFRREVGLSQDDFVVGHVGRLAEEKNLPFLCEAAAIFLKAKPDARFLVVGDGPHRASMEKFFVNAGLGDRVVLAGKKADQALIDAYHAMDVFAFSSLTETQGMVLAEAMAAGCPVVALKAPGVNDLVKHGENGYIVEDQDQQAFANMLVKQNELADSQREAMVSEAIQTANDISMYNCADRMLEEYERTISNKSPLLEKHEKNWTTRLESLRAEWDLFLKYANAAGEMFSTHSTTGGR